ncbi:hypothetical protein BCR42DRAFT_420552 [Absidia repens]|uniref:DH domain-containing protein n=1 Tax=Absidia repens TaxID=90262 RepID=A0A1X2I9V7_9FUNG|nr:hypothetical protein BCR42DRAFT_420552 [Absidia repens]
MGKFLHFKSLSSAPNDGYKHPHPPSLGPTAGKIVKRTSHFLQKKAAKFTQQAYHFQQQHHHHQQHQPNSHYYYQQLLSPSTSSSTTSFIPPQQQQQQYAASVQSFSGNAGGENDEMAHDRFSQAYATFLATHDLRQNWPKSWKDGLNPHDADYFCLNPAQLQFQELLYEVILTENTYVDDLTLAYQIFAKDALTWSTLPKSLRLIFDNLVQIIRLHLGLLQDLRQRQSSQHPIVRTIGDIFLTYAPRFLDYYSAYFINFEKANEVVVRSMASKTDQLGVYFRTRSNWPECRNLTLQSFLLKPVQRLMKYPLFFKSLSDSLPHSDPDRVTHLRTLHELKLVIQRIEVDKKESEDDRKLEDLALRIRGIPGKLATPGRRLIYEGYLTLVPSLQVPLMRSVTKDALGGQHYTYAPHPNVAPTRSHSFSSSTTSASNKKRLYVFLFNDMILCTKVRSKTRVVEEDIKPQNYYGPNPQALFKLEQSPGQLTFVDRSVSRLVEGKDNSHHGSKTSLRFGSLRRTWSNHSSIHPSSSLMDSASSDYEEHPQQFICSIATRHITNYHFETATADEKNQWCAKLEQVLESHVQRPDWWNPVENDLFSSASQTSMNFSDIYQPKKKNSDIASLAAHHLGLSTTSAAEFKTPSSSLLHEKTELPTITNHFMDHRESAWTPIKTDTPGFNHGQGEMDIDSQQSTPTSWELKPLPPIQYQVQDDQQSTCSSTSSSSSSSCNSDSSGNDDDSQAEKMETFTTAASSPVHGIFHYQRSSNSSNNPAPSPPLENVAVNKVTLGMPSDPSYSIHIETSTSMH